MLESGKGQTVESQYLLEVILKREDVPHILRVSI